jgi:hypothetical protein
MSEFKAGALHSGSKTGPVVTDRKQAIAIALSPRNKVSPAKRAMRDRATKGSPPFEHPEFRAGYRTL